MRRKAFSGILRRVAALWTANPIGAPRVGCFTVVQHRFFGSNEGHAMPSETHLAELDDFEAALLGAEGGIGAATATLEEAEGPAARHPSTPDAFSCDIAVQEVLDVLPTDGSTVPLTSLTCMVDIEAVADHCGSLLALLQLYPHLLSVERAGYETASRWVVCRKSALRPSGLETTLPPPPQVGSRQQNAHRHSHRTERRLVTTTTATPAAAAALMDASMVKRICSAVGDTPTDMFTLRTILTQDCEGPLAQALAEVERTMSLRAMLHCHPLARQLLVWCDANHVADRRAFSEDALRDLDEKAAVTASSPPTVSVVPDAEYASDPWLVDLDLDSEPTHPSPDDVDDALPVQAQPHVAALSPELLEGIPRIPPPSPAQRSAVRRMAPPPPGLLRQRAAVTSAAKPPPPHASRPSAILLELFLEVVPAHPVPTQALRTSDALQRVLGSAPLVKVLRRFPAVFVVDNVVGTVCAKASASSRSAAADALYSACARTAQTPMPPITSAVRLDGRTERELRMLVSSVMQSNMGPPPRREHVETQRKGPATTTGASAVPSAPPPPPPLSLSSGSGLCIWQLPTECFTTTAAMRQGGEGALADFVGQHWEALWQQGVLVVFRGSDPTQQVDRLPMRLRPFHCSPSAIGALDRTTTPLTASAHASMLARLKPLWTPIDRWMERMESGTVDAFRTVVASGGLGLPMGIQALQGDSANAPRGDATPASHAALLVLLMHGRDVWVSRCGTKIRRYTGHPELDDEEHYVVALLHASLPLPQPGPGEVTDGTVDLVAHTLQQPFAKVFWGAAVTPSSDAVRAVAGVLALHKARFVVVQQPAEPTMGGCGWRIGRYSPFRLAHAASPRQQQGTDGSVPLTSPLSLGHTGRGASGSWADVVRKRVA